MIRAKPAPYAGSGAPPRSPGMTRTLQTMLPVKLALWVQAQAARDHKSTSEWLRDLVARERGRR